MSDQSRSFDLNNRRILNKIAEDADMKPTSNMDNMDDGEIDSIQMSFEEFDDEDDEDDCSDIISVNNSKNDSDMSTSLPSSETHTPPLPNVQPSLSVTNSTVNSGRVAVPTLSMPPPNEDECDDGGQYRCIKSAIDDNDFQVNNGISDSGTPPVMNKHTFGDDGQTKLIGNELCNQSNNSAHHRIDVHQYGNDIPNENNDTKRCYHCQHLTTDLGAKCICTVVNNNQLPKQQHHQLLHHYNRNLRRLYCNNTNSSPSSPTIDLTHQQRTVPPQLVFGSSRNVAACLTNSSTTHPRNHRLNCSPIVANEFQVNNSNKLRAAQKSPSTHLNTMPRHKFTLENVPKITTEDCTEIAMHVTDSAVNLRNKIPKSSLKHDRHSLDMRNSNKSIPNISSNILSPLNKSTGNSLNSVLSNDSYYSGGYAATMVSVNDLQSNSQQLNDEYIQINADKYSDSTELKRNKSFRERIQKVWGKNNDVDPLNVNRKKPVSTRLSILGKPLPVNKRKEIKYHKERTLVYNFLQRPKGKNAMTYHFFVIMVVCIGLFFASMTTVKGMEQWSLKCLRVIDIFIIILLSIEFIARVWSASAVSKYQGKYGTLRFVLSPFRVIDLFVIVVSGIILWIHLTNPTDTRYFWLRFAQVFQILRIGNRFKPWRIMGSVIWSQRQHLAIGIYMSFLCLMFISFTVYFAERDDPDTNFTSIPMTLWWGVITLFTIGYGDMAPKTTSGQVVATLFILLSVSIFALPAGILGTGLALKVQEEQRQKHINKRRIPAAQLIQCAWRCYASSPNSTSNSTWKACIKEDKRSTKKFASKLSLEDTLNDHHGECLSTSASVATFRGKYFDDENLIKERRPLDSISRITVDESRYNANSQFDLGNYSNYFTPQEKICIRFIRLARYRMARRKFKNAFKPNDINDVMEQYAAGHADLLGRVRSMQARINSLQGAMGSIVKNCQDMNNNQHIRFETVEKMFIELSERIISIQNAYTGPKSSQCLNVNNSRSQSRSSSRLFMMPEYIPPMYSTLQFDNLHSNQMLIVPKHDDDHYQDCVACIPFKRNRNFTL